MKLEMRDVIGKHKGQKAIVLGHGPSLDNYKVHLEGWKRDGCLLVGCNEWYHIYSTVPHYWVLANSIQTMSSDAANINRHAGQTIVMYADTVDMTDRAWIEQNIKCDYLPYDQRHFLGQPCFCKIYCKHLIPGRVTIQQELQKLTGAPNHYGSGDTVVLHAMALAVLAGCNPVHVVGMDLDYKMGYATNTGNLIQKVHMTDLEEFRSRILGDVVKINESARLIGTKIINLNKQSTFDALEIGELT